MGTAIGKVDVNGNTIGTLLSVIVSVVKDEVTLNCTSVMRRVLEKRRGVLKADGVNHT